MTRLLRTLSVLSLVALALALLAPAAAPTPVTRADRSAEGTSTTPMGLQPIR